MATKVLFIFITLILSGCVRTVVKYDQFGPPAETTSFKREREKDDLAEKIGSIPPLFRSYTSSLRPL